MVFIAWCSADTSGTWLEWLVTALVPFPQPNPSSRRWLPQDHALKATTKEAPAPRTHDASCQHARESEASHLRWEHQAHPRKLSGINYVCPLVLLKLFDVVWDVLPDFMHLNKTFCERLLLGVYKGERAPKLPATVKPAKPSRRSTRAEQATYKQALSDYNKHMGVYHEAVQANRECTFSKGDQDLVDQRVKNLVGVRNPAPVLGVILETVSARLGPKTALVGGVSCVFGALVAVSPWRALLWGVSRRFSRTLALFGRYPTVFVEYVR